MSEQTEGAEVETLAEIVEGLTDLPLSWDFFPDPDAALDDVARLIAARDAAAEARGAKVVLNALADRLDFWDGRPWEGEESTSDILTFCERAFAAAARGVEGGA